VLAKPDGGLLRLRLSLPAPIPSLGTPSLTVAATLVDLGILYDLASKAWEYQVPLVGLLEALRRKPSTDLDALERPQDLSAYQWAAARLLPLDRLVPPGIDPNRLAQVQEMAVLHRTSEVLLLESVTGAEQLVLDFRVPGAYLSDSEGFWVFVRVVEHLYGSPGAIQVVATPLDDDAPRSGLREGPSHRQAIALDGIELLVRDTGGVALLSGELSIGRPS
jgi:hypothetical protein